MTRTSQGLFACVAAAGLVLCGGVAQAAPEVARIQAEVVVKVDLAAGHTIDELVARLPIVIDSGVLASRGIYLVRSTDPQYSADATRSGELDGKAERLAQRIEQSGGVVYAEPNYQATLTDTRYHAWPEGDPDDAGTDPAVWTDQAATRELSLAEAHGHSTGADTSVAVLDSGIDVTHPALAGRLVPGWDYVDDDDDPAEAVTGTDTDGDGIADEAYGHGTFVAGLVALLAPDARIMPARVLDGDGRGNVFAVSEAVFDAAEAGADVINLSFGTPLRTRSRLLADAIWSATQRGVVVVAAAGNDRNNQPHYPAAEPGVLSVTALAADGTQLAEFAAWGGWVDVAAPGERIVGPVPGARYAWWSGTSTAAAFVAGQAALIKAINPTLGTGQICEAITHTATSTQGSRRSAYGAIDLLASLTYTSAERQASSR